jgi:LPS-assembly lipoprotein
MIPLSHLRHSRAGGKPWPGNKGGLLLGLLFTLLLPACGFSPLHKAPPAAERADIAISNIPDREGQFLRNLLIDRLRVSAKPLDPRYLLVVEPLRITATDLGIQKDATVTRTQLEIATRLRLLDNRSGAALLERQLHAVGGYDVLDRQYATLVTRQYATENILGELADSAVRELDLHFRRAGEAAIQGAGSANIQGAGSAP